MIEDQIVTILTAIIQGGIILAVLWYFSRRFMSQLQVVETAAGEQKRSLDAIGRRVEETEKVGDLYRALLTNPPEDIESCKRLLDKLRKDAIASLAEGDRRKDDELKRLSQVKIEKLDLQLQMISEIPALKEQLSDLLNLISTRYQIIQDYSVVRATPNSISASPAGSAVTDPQSHPPGHGGHKGAVDHEDEDTDVDLWKEKRRESE